MNQLRRASSGSIQKSFVASPQRSYFESISARSRTV
ncbi:MAG: hypothetical protein ACI91F_002562, partial [Candidatus Binatia bacterium]